DHHRKLAKVVGKGGRVVPFAAFGVDENRTRCGQTAWLGERLVGKKDPVFLFHLEGLEAEPTRPGAFGQFLVGGMAILRGAASLPHLVGKGGGDTGVAMGGHQKGPVRVETNTIASW